MADINIHLVPGLEEAVRHLPELHRTTRDAADAAASIARSMAPVDEGDYVAGIEVQDTPGGGARVLASDQKSAWIEFGIPSRGIPANFVLRRAAEAAGLSFKKRS
jgi:hypothetical protein